jgi:hypothetical protein
LNVCVAPRFGGKYQIMGPLRATLLLATLGAGCATSLSSFQPAHVASKGHVQAEGGMDVSIPTGTISKTIDAAKTLASAAQSRSLSEAERRQLIEAGANLALDPPATVFHFGVAYVPFERWEVGLRYSSGGWRIGGRRQLLAVDRDGLDLSVGLAAGRHSTSYPIDKILDVLTLEDFTRYSLEIPIVAGTHGSWYRLWGGPRLLLARYTTAMNLNLPATGATPAEVVAASVKGTATFIGAQGGFAIGYAHLFVALELTIVQLISTAELRAANQGQDADLGGTIVYPGFAVMGEF